MTYGVAHPSGARALCVIEATKRMRAATIVSDPYSSIWISGCLPASEGTAKIPTKKATAVIMLPIQKYHLQVRSWSAIPPINIPRLVQSLESSRHYKRQLTYILWDHILHKDWISCFCETQDDRIFQWAWVMLVTRMQDRNPALHDRYQLLYRSGRNPQLLTRSRSRRDRQESSTIPHTYLRYGQQLRRTSQPRGRRHWRAMWKPHLGCWDCGWEREG